MMNQDKSQTQQGTEGKRTGGVPHEEHELLIREAVFYKEQLTLLAKEKSMSVDTILVRYFLRMIE